MNKTYMRSGMRTKLPASSWMEGYVATKSLSIVGAKGPRPLVEMLRTAFSSEKGRERRQEREEVVLTVEAQEVLVTMVSYTV